MGTQLYEQWVVGDTSEHGDMMREVWSHNRWIMDVFTGRCAGERDYEIRRWLNDTFGRETWPFGETPRPGRWMRGSATLHGWTWIGFSTRAEMETFAARWPTPAEELRPTLPIEQRADASELSRDKLEQSVSDTAAKAEE